uniref:Ubiquitin fusion degradation protein 1 isogeny n=2 Tax=Cajanus cajan TaxID=3821 RepID=A0A151TMG9_CAJCA|nr:Ubiquitin fusion degradation protein 1 isogeny [Cajanus cajan]
MFEEVYRCYPVSFIEKSNLENGGKIIMPPSALHSLVSLDMEYPVLFELTNPSAERVTNCGVQEFTADEGNIYMPEWMMENMRLEVGNYVSLRSTSLPSGTYVKLQPHTKDFLDLSDPKSILEYSLRSYSCLTTGDTIMIAYNNKKYYIDIVETKPSPAISIIETDCEVDFAQPLDYKEPEKELSPPLPDNGPNEVQDNSETKTAGIIPFTGSARRLDGKPSTQSAEESPFSMLKQQPTENETKNSNSKPSRTSGKLVFGTNAPKIQTPPKASLESTPQESSSEEKPKFEAFTGKKYSLKD